MKVCWPHLRRSLYERAVVYFLLSGMVMKVYANGAGWVSIKWNEIWTTRTRTG